MIYKGIFTVLFENPFWIGLYERIEGERYEVCKITFGTEPKDYEVYDYWLANCDKLQFSQPIKIEKTEERKTNPKRVQREINHQLQKKGIGTRASENRTENAKPRRKRS